MKIVISGYIGKKITGIGRNLLSLLEHTGNDNEYIIYANEDMAQKLKLAKDNVHIRTYGVSSQSSIGNLLWTTFVFPFKARKEKADVSLIPNFSLLLFKTRPSSVIIHDLIEFNVPGKFSGLRMFYRTKIADPLLAKLSDRIITISKCSMEDLNKYLGTPENKVDIVYCGVDRQKFHKMELKTALNILKAKEWPSDFFLCAGTVDHPGKNSYSVIKAFEQICSNGYKGGLILAGMPGSGYEHVERAIAESPYGNRIIVTGYVCDEELVALYSACRALCFMSLYEGFGMPPLEALSCGAQVIVSSTSSLPEVVGDCGQKVDPLDVNAISEAMVNVLEGWRANPGQVEKHLARFDYQVLSKQFEESLARTAGDSSKTVQGK